MSHIKTQIGKIAYNPALECYEALVTFHSEFGRFSVAASLDAPLGADFETVSDGLLRDALDGLSRAGRLRSRLAPARPAPHFTDPPCHAA